MELRHLRYFLAVAEELHFSRAAKKLNISQPPLSIQIRQLEEEIGVELFIRTKRHVELTEAGLFFQEASHKILYNLEKTCQDTRDIYLGEIGHLNIGLTGSWSSYLINLLIDFRAKFPKISPVFHQLSSSDQIQALHEKKIQIGFLCPPIDKESFNTLLIYRAPFIAAIPASHPLANDKSPLDVQELENQPFIMTQRETEPGYYDAIISLCHQAGFTPRIFQEAGGLFTILSLVAAELGISLVSKLASEHALPGIVYRELKGNHPTAELFLAWRKDNDSPIVNKFMTLARESLNCGNSSENGGIKIS